MQFGPDATTELVIPAGVPFQPGFDVIGIGTALPPELAAYVPIPGGDPVKAAIVFYSSAYDPTLATPQVKFFWMGIGSAGTAGSSLSLGTGIVKNASLSQVAIVNSGYSVVPSNNGAGNIAMLYVSVNHNDNNIGEIGERNTTGDGQLVVLNNAGTVAGTVP